MTVDDAESGGAFRLACRGGNRCACIMAQAGAMMIAIVGRNGTLDVGPARRIDSDRACSVLIGLWLQNATL